MYLSGDLISSDYLNRFANRPTPGEPGEWITEAGRGSRQHPGGPRQSAQNHVGTHRKISKKSAKIPSGTIPGASRIALGPFRSTPKRRQRKKIKKVCQCENTWDGRSHIWRAPQANYRDMPLVLVSQMFTMKLENVSLYLVARHCQGSLKKTTSKSASM